MRDIGESGLQFTGISADLLRYLFAQRSENRARSLDDENTT